MRTRKQSDEVLFADENMRFFSFADVEELARQASVSSTGRLRICLHRSPDSELHEMLIALRSDVQYPPHKNVKSEETHFVLSGKAMLCLYEATGKCYERLPLGDSASGRMSYSRIPVDVYHALEIESDVCVFLETKLGPFNSMDNIFLPINE